MPDGANPLANVDDSRVFWSHDGRILHNLRELEEALITMSEETFTYHCNAEKNDFSNWVKDVLQDDKLAKDLGRSHSASLAAKKVKERIQLLTGKRA